MVKKIWKFFYFSKMFQTPPEKILGILNPLETPKNPYISKNQIFPLNPPHLDSNVAFAIIYIWYVINWDLVYISHYKGAQNRFRGEPSENLGKMTGGGEKKLRKKSWEKWEIEKFHRKCTMYVQSTTNVPFEVKTSMDTVGHRIVSVSLWKPFAVFKFK